jgi:hypothetical protein
MAKFFKNYSYNYLYLQKNKTTNIDLFIFDATSVLKLPLLEFLSPAALHRAARFWRRLMRVEIRASPILKDPRESNGCRSCRSCAAQQTIAIPPPLAVLDQKVTSL